MDQTAIDIEPQTNEVRARQGGGEILRPLLRETLLRVLDCASTLETEGEKGVHQLRVALRRARTMASIVRRGGNDGLIDELAVALRWAGQELGPARDLDTLLQGALAPDIADAPAGFAALRVRAQEKRAQAFDKARASIASPAWREQIERVAARLGDAPADKGARGVIAEAARKELRRRWRKLRKRAKHAADGGVETLHALRIQAKKQRFAIELFADIFPDARRKRDRMLAALKRLLDRLGALNDIATHRSLLVDLAAEGGDAGGYAAGFLAGQESACAEALISKAEAALSKLIEVKPFWK